MLLWDRCWQCPGWENVPDGVTAARAKPDSNEVGAPTIDISGTGTVHAW